MRLRSLRLSSRADSEAAAPRAALETDRGPILLSSINAATGASWPETVEGLVTAERVAALRDWVASAGDALATLPVVDAHEATPAALLRRPPKILGVGLNYEAHAGDLGEKRPTEPATFMKPATTILAPGDSIPIPLQSERTTGEAELGLIIGTRCKNVREEDAPGVVAGVTTIIDMTAEDILQRNPRFLTRAKSFDGFLVLGPTLVTVDELGPIEQIEVSTRHNGEAVRTNSVANMMFKPWYLVAFFSAIMPLEPGDVISTGTPGAIPLAHGDTVGCTIPGIGAIENPVHDLKVDGAGRN